MIVYSGSQVWIARPSHLFKKKPWHFLQQPCPGKKKNPHTRARAHTHRRTRCNPDPEPQRLQQAPAGRDTIGAQSSGRDRTQCHLSPISLSQRLFSPPPRRSATFGRIKARRMYFFFVLARMQAGDPDRNSNKCTAERTRGDVQKYLRCPGCRYCPASTAII